MEMLWPVLVIMIPLFIGGVIALAMYWAHAPVGERGVPEASAPRLRSAGGGKGGRRRLPTNPFAIALYVAAGLVVAVMLAVFVGFPVLRSLLMAIQAPIDPG
jgi:hypothetical protein